MADSLSRLRHDSKINALPLAVATHFCRRYVVSFASGSIGRVHGLKGFQRNVGNIKSGSMLEARVRHASHTCEGDAPRSMRLLFFNAHPPYSVLLPNGETVLCRLHPLHGPSTEHTVEHGSWFADVSAGQSPSVQEPAPARAILVIRTVGTSWQDLREVRPRSTMGGVTKTGAVCLVVCKK